MEEEFEKIAQELFERAARIECSIEEYMEGLQYIREMLDERISAAETDLTYSHEDGDL